MTREIRLFLLTTVLPALLVAAGGARLLALEAARDRAADHETLRLRTVAVAADVERAVADRVARLLPQVAAEPDTAARIERARRIAAAEPDVERIDVYGADPERGRGGAPRHGPGGPGEPGGPGPRHGPGGPDGPGGPGPRHGPGGEGPGGRFFFETTLASGEACRVQFERDAAAAFCRTALEALGPDAEPAPLGFVLETGTGLAFVRSDTVTDPVFVVGEAPVLRTNANLVVSWSAAEAGSPHRLYLLGGCLLALLVCSLVAGGARLVGTIRRERRDARAKADFFDNVSHELKTPLAGIRMNAELLLRGRIPDEASRRGAMDAILGESDRLGRMVEELLEFGRLEKGTRRYRLETFDLAAFAREPAEEQGVAAVSGGRARIVLRGPGAAVRADKDALRQIGVALLSNAVKYAEGPIDIEIEGAELRYMDRGPGVPRGAEERVFERGWRADDSLAAGTAGSGLGLAIARALARGMGGDLAYRHRPGGGSVFVLTLRRAPRAEPPEPPKP